MQKSHKTSFFKIGVLSCIIGSIIFIGVPGIGNIFFAWGLPLFFFGESQYEAFREYNTLLSSRGSSAIKLLENMHLTQWEGAKYELLGDALYVGSGSKEKIRDSYMKALIFSPNDRVREKLQILSLQEATPTSGSGVKERSPPSSSTIAEEDAANNRLEEDTKNRSLYIRNNGQIVPDTTDFSIFLEETIDW